ncbi:hypothetical protein BGZ83_001732 [Gryganskiella cystojenkinii]|nr:hypothetical protein BGZ83_001732 [Gryganskiella cystojenkinii]
MLCAMRHIILLLGAAVTCVRAAYYVIDVNYAVQLPGVGEGMTFNGVLRYAGAANVLMAYEECGSPSNMVIPEGQPGIGMKCKGLKNSMGLYFPDKFNATTTVTAAYDYYRQEFYPCQKVNEDFNGVITYVCGGVHVDFESDEPTTTTTNAPATTAVPTSAVAVNTTTVVPSTTVHSTVRTTIATPSPTSSCAAGAYGKKRGQGKAGQCCKTDADCKQSCMKGVCGTCGINFKC